MAKKKNNIDRLQAEIKALQNAIKNREYGDVKYGKNGFEFPISASRVALDKIIQEMERIREGKSPDPSRDYITKKTWDEDKARIENNFLRKELDAMKKSNSSLKGQNTKLENKVTWRNQEIKKLRKRIEEMNNFGRADILDFEE